MVGIEARDVSSPIAAHRRTLALLGRIGLDFEARITVAVGQSKLGILRKLLKAVDLVPVHFDLIPSLNCFIRVTFWFLDF